GISAKLLLDQAVGTFPPQWLHAELGVVAATTPDVLVFGAIRDQHHDGRHGNGVRDLVEQLPRFRISPMSILEQQHQRLTSALPEQEAPDPSYHLASPL